MLRQYGLLVLTRLILPAVFLWALAGALVFPRLLSFVGLDWLNGEQQGTLFALLTLIGAVALAFVMLLVLRMFERKKPRRTSR